MKRDFKSIPSKTYDVIVIGGGIVELESPAILPYGDWIPC